MIYRNASEIKKTPLQAASMPLPKRILTVDPSFFDVEYIINPHMAGHVGNVDRDLAHFQWSDISASYRRFGFDVQLLPGRVGLPDMVFCANQSLPYIDENGECHVLMSIMANPERKAEVVFVEEWYRDNGYTIHYLPADGIKDFEGMGDALWHPGRKFIYGGFGHRSSQGAYEYISSLWNVDCAIFELPDPDFYHLDTCLCLLNETTALYFPGAFTADGVAMLKKLIPNLIEVPDFEARKKFACNATCPDGKHVLIEPGSPHTNAMLREHGFQVVLSPTSEFMKSGGSVFCMKMMVW